MPAGARASRAVISALALALACACACACGCAGVSTKVTGSARAGTEQLLQTGAWDRVLCSVDFGPLAGSKVFLDSAHISAADSGWVIFTLRRRMAEQGLLLVEKAEEADLIVDAALGAYGTDEKDCQLALPQFSMVGALPVPTATGTSTSSGSGLIRKSKQDAVVKLALYAYDAKTRHLVWETPTLYATAHNDRAFIGKSIESRRTSLPELESYPPRRGRLGW